MLVTLRGQSRGLVTYRIYNRVEKAHRRDHPLYEVHEPVVKIHVQFFRLCQSFSPPFYLNISRTTRFPGNKLSLYRFAQFV